MFHQLKLANKEISTVFTVNKNFFMNSLLNKKNKKMVKWATKDDLESMNCKFGSFLLLSSSGPGPGPGSGPVQVPGQVQKVQGLRTKDLDLGSH